MTQAARINWQKLLPQKPLEAGAEEYVSAPDRGASDIVKWVRAGAQTLLVVGPTGAGKSTELAQVAHELELEREGFCWRLDQLENLHQISWELFEYRLFTSTFEILSGRYPSALSPQTRFYGAEPSKPRPWSAILALFREYRSAVQQPISIILDGLEKVPETQIAPILSGLGQLPVELVLVMPWHVAFGPRVGDVVREGERFVWLRALDPATTEGRTFLRDLVARRLQNQGFSIDRLTPPDLDRLIDQSGGLPRTLLQLLADAGTHARVRRDADWPESEDIDEAIWDQEDSFRRLLLPGDTEALKAAEGTDGRELDAARKVRLMAMGLLLERLVERRPVLQIHPLARRAVFEVK